MDSVTARFSARKVPCALPADLDLSPPSILSGNNSIKTEDVTSPGNCVDFEVVADWWVDA